MLAVRSGNLAAQVQCLLLWNRSPAARAQRLLLATISIERVVVARKTRNLRENRVFRATTAVHDAPIRPPIRVGSIQKYKILYFHSQTLYFFSSIVLSCAHRCTLIRLANLPEPEFVDTHDSFTVTLRKHPTERQDSASAGGADLVAFCSVPRSRIEIAQFLGLESVPYASRVYIAPAVREGVLRMTLPDKPRSSKQRYVAAR